MILRQRNARNSRVQYTTCPGSAQGKSALNYSRIARVITAGSEAMAGISKTPKIFRASREEDLGLRLVLLYLSAHADCVPLLFFGIGIGL